MIPLRVTGSLISSTVVKRLAHTPSRIESDAIIENIRTVSSPAVEKLSLE